MEVHLTPEQEAQLAKLATNTGIDSEQLVKQLVLRLIRDDVNARPPASELPVWDLGTVGDMHRRDIYDDAF